MSWREESSLYIDLHEGDQVEGTLEAVEAIDLPGKEEKATRYTFLVNGGERVSFLGGASLDRCISEKKIQPGAKLRVKHCGEKDLGGGRKVKLFRVWQWIDGDGGDGGGGQS